MPIGAGGAPAGSSAAGYGVPDRAFVPNNAVLPDLRTGFSQTGRAIDPTSKSYTFTSDGRLRGLATVPQLVQLALSTIRGTATIPTLGQTFMQIQEKGSDFAGRITNAVNLALADLVKAQQVQVISVNVYQPPSNPDAGLGWIKWKDLTTGLQDTTKIGP
jgi:hypothetical protein